MFDHSADVVEAGFRQAGIFITGKSRLTVLPDRHMGVHAATIIVLDRLGHKGCCLAVSMGDLMDDIFVNLHPVGGLRQFAKGNSQLVLRGGHFMVMLVHWQAHFEHGGDHFGADIHCTVDRTDGEVPALGTRPVAHIAAFIFLAGIGRKFDIVDRITRASIAVFETHIVEHEEFRFRPDIDRIADPSRLQIGFSAFRSRAGVT